MALTAKAQTVLDKMGKAAPYMTDKTLDYLQGAADVLLMQHEDNDPDRPKTDKTEDKKPA